MGRHIENASEYRSWERAKARCLNPNHHKYPLYGGRGIRVCDRWRGSWPNFFADMGPKPGREYSLDRIDTNGDYEPGNCRWATRQQQQRNRRNNIYVWWENRRWLVAELAEEYKLDYNLLAGRLKMGWLIWDAIFKPVRPKRKAV
jgi:hypothetical protein